MSSLAVSVSQFEVIETNLNVELIIPVLEDSGLLSSPDKEKLAQKSQKQAVKFILKKVKQQPESSKLFHDVLEKTKANACRTSKHSSSFVSCRRFGLSSRWYD